jgi:glycerol-3-phosphate O-acyltransferase / dihydroxyacetone phosphate acyltransferase
MLLYRLMRVIVRFSVRLFYRVEVVRRVDNLSGPVMFVSNHPNSLVDPALLFACIDRPVTFLAREPLFRVPVFGALLRGLGALPVYRKQDHPGLMEKNEGTLEAASRALSAEQAITIFPEGKSHSEPQLSDIKTGGARIAYRVAHAGKALRIIPVGLTYAQKHRFRSEVHVEIGEPVLVEATTEAAEQAWVRQLTERVAEALRTVTLSLEQWDDLDLIDTVDQLYVLRNAVAEDDPLRRRLLARAAALLRVEQPDRFDDFKEDVMSFRSRLKMVDAKAKDLQLTYRMTPVVRFVLRNLAALSFGLPLFALGLFLFGLPFVAVRVLSRAVKLSKDRIATLKLMSALVVVPAWWVFLSVCGWAAAGMSGLVVALLGTLPLALFTRYFLERWRNVVADIRVFVRLGNRSGLKQQLLFQGERLQDEVARLESELLPKLQRLHS